MQSTKLSLSVASQVTKTLTTRRGMAAMPLKKIGVIGLGQMGNGIAMLAASSGYEVVGMEVAQEFLDKAVAQAKKGIPKVFQKKLEKGYMAGEIGALSYEDTMKEAEKSVKRYTGTLDINQLADCDMVVEAIRENFDDKSKLLANLNKVCKPSTILASNTSSLNITDLGTAGGRPEMTVGVHFFNPVAAMKLVEVIKTKDTKQDVFDSAFEFAKKIKKTPISCKDTPGFVVNRLLVPFLGCAISLVERGDASIPDVDTSMRLGAGHPMGPFTLADYVGLDTCYYILDGWAKKFPNDPSFRVPETLKKKVQEGKLGTKSGEGFYKWKDGKPQKA